jgi:hypothetical protein
MTAVDVPLTRKDRLRRVVLVCCSFIRNLAFFRTGRERGSHLLKPSAECAAFWQQVDSNCIDMCVLEWCKLFSDKQPQWDKLDKSGQHHWEKIVSDPATFEAELHRCLGMDADAFNTRLGKVRYYRNNCVAHLGSDRQMNIPMLDFLEKSVRFYHAHVVNSESQAGDLAGLPDTPEKFSVGYEQCVKEAVRVFQRFPV